MIQYRTTLEGLSPEQLEGFFVGWRKPLTKEQHFDILKNSSHFVLAFNMEINKVVGFINALSDGVHFAFIPMLEVLPEYQNRGIGSELMRQMFGLVGNMTCIDLTCDLNMQRFYKRFGMLESHGMIVRKYL